MAVEWTDEERAAASPWEVFVDTDGYNSIRAKTVGNLLDALAPFVAAREAQAAAKALRKAANEWQTGGWADDLPPAGASRVQLILGMSQRACGWLRDRADRIERGES